MSYSSRRNDDGIQHCDGYEGRGHAVWGEKLSYYNGHRLCSACKAGLQGDYRKSHRDHRKRVGKLNDDVAAFASQNNMEVKCVSDKILLYCRYSVSVLAQKNEPESRKDENTKLVLGVCDRICSSIRGDMEFTNKNPRTIAGAIVYVACVMSGTRMTQHEVAVSLDMTDKTIRENYLLVKTALKL